MKLTGQFKIVFDIIEASGEIDSANLSKIAYQYGVGDSQRIARLLASPQYGSVVKREYRDNKVNHTRKLVVWKVAETSPEGRKQAQEPRTASRQASGQMRLI